MQKDDQSLVQVISSSLLEQLCKIPDEVNEMTEEELVEEVNPNRNLKRLRARFNHERNLAQMESRKLSISRVCEGVIHPNYWPRLIDDKKKLAYITRPIAAVMEECQVLQSDFMEGLRKLAAVDPTNCPPGVRVSDWLAAVKIVLDRTAPTVQRVHQLNEHKNAGNTRPKELEDINDKIKKLEEELGRKKE